jgi:hypothetical protein
MSLKMVTTHTRYIIKRKRKEKTLRFQTKIKGKEELHGVISNRNDHSVALSCVDWEKGKTAMPNWGSSTKLV